MMPYLFSLVKNRRFQLFEDLFINIFFSLSSSKAVPREVILPSNVSSYFFGTSSSSGWSLYGWPVNVRYCYFNRQKLMLEEYFRWQSQSQLLQYKNQEVLTDSIRKKIVNCMVDFMVEVLASDDPKKIEKSHKIRTAKVAVELFTGLKSNDPDDPLVKYIQ